MMALTEFRGGKRERLSVSKVSKSSWTPMNNRWYKYGSKSVQLCVFSQPSALFVY